MISVTSLINIQIVTYTKLAMLALLSYDYILSLAQEVTHIWNSKWGPVKVLYLYSRYSPFIDTTLAVVERLYPQMSSESCNRLMAFNTLFSGSGIGLSDVILMVRTYSMYHNSRKILVVLVLSWTTVSIISLVAALKWSGSFSAVTVPGLPGCVLVGESKTGIVDNAFFLAAETVVVILTLWRGFRHFYSFGFTLEITQKVTMTFYRDGVLYYLAILPFTLGNVVVLATAPPELQILETPLRVMHSILCCKLIIHIREVAKAEDEGEEVESLEEIAFRREPSVQDV
ncbi:hypothetical protein GYMLUDRAFT_703922 [Collybiopsis luxurians FD-317 M1]|uniref:DUF6533 domain-containing protein n=1 Tax=Collybiopsis luxurians FD-317 M1 TaxID=944289 RepID=A0A0D0CIA2_9AGAR|nr:hypothetical protein GYMLUDRAFT_703922 [Collybiopsis luxurians FD-317 M1]